MADPSASTSNPTPSSSQQPAASNGTDANGTSSSAADHGNPLDSLSNAELRKKLESSKKELRGYLDKKKRIDRELAILEVSIHAFEGSYLSDALIPAAASGNQNNSNQFGNIIKGYDAYLKTAATGGDRKRGRGAEEAKDGERMFSRSSATWQKALDLKNAEQAESASEEEAAVPTTTAPAPRKRRRDR